MKVLKLKDGTLRVEVSNDKFVIKETYVKKKKRCAICGRTIKFGEVALLYKHDGIKEYICSHCYKVVEGD